MPGIKTAFLPLSCWGRNASLEAVLDKPIQILVMVASQGGSLTIAVDCPHNTGSHGHRCKASHPEVDKVGDGISCPYAIDLPCAILDEHFRRG